jgi:uncharacterized protein YndB with AHSA1/START domain
MTKGRAVGQTKSQGWEIGLRRTFPIGTDKAWELLTTQPGLGYWLGHGIEFPVKKGDEYKTKEKTTGEIRSYNEGSLIRMTWQPHDKDFASTLQVRVMPAKTGATIGFHHEKLQNNDQREAMHRHWTEVMDKLAKLVKAD